MEDFDDFELEAPRLMPSKTSKRKRKAIQLDDLIEEIQKEKAKPVKQESRKGKLQKEFDSDGDRDYDFRETDFCRSFAKIQEDMCQINGDDETPVWGLQCFGDQETWPLEGFPNIASCELLQSFKEHELNSDSEFDPDKGENFIEGLLERGWLLKLVCIAGRLEESIAKWTLNLLLYSSKEVLRTSACSFWSALLSKCEGNPLSIKMEWLPCYSELETALKAYGFLLDPLSEVSSDINICKESSSLGPPQNIGCWIKFVIVCCQMRCVRPVLSALNAEDLIIVIASMFLDRRLLGFFVLLNQCMIAAISYFSDVEWDMSLPRIVKSLAGRLSADVNCLRLLECISAADGRGKHLRSAVAFQLLLSCLSENLTLEVVEAPDVLRWLLSLNLKDKACDFFRVYIYMNLGQNWVMYDSLGKDKREREEMWGLFLQKCSCQIGSTDLRPFASKVRNRATFLLQLTPSPE